MFYRIFFKKFSFPIIYSLIVFTVYLCFILSSFLTIYNNWSTDNHPGKVDWIISRPPGTIPLPPTSEEILIKNAFGFYENSIPSYIGFIFIYLILFLCFLVI
ncbi:hypothetical protein MSGX11T_00544 [Mycoplasma synoviae GX11-T]|nr:hypothetical protein [Mycoplasmopsis synoviae GX11-T]